MGCRDRQRLQIDQSEEVNGPEIAIKRGRATNFRPDGQIGAQKFGYLGRFFGKLVQRAIEGGEWLGAPSRLDQMFPAQVGVGRSPYFRIL